MKFTTNDYKSFCQMCKMTEPTLLRAMEKVLRNYYTNVSSTKHYVLAEGDINVALIAHLDTVHTSLPQDIYLDKTCGVVWSPQGLGADDRAGVFGIISILREGYRPHIILTTGEEKGAVGASILANKWSNPPFPIDFMIQLDRRGKKDCVFYGCDNKDFIKFIESYGFKTAWGTFTDISVLAPAWGVSAVNLSIGYEDEHSLIERLYLQRMFATIEKVIKILKDAKENPKNFPYIPMSLNMMFYHDAVCDSCGDVTPAELLTDVYYDEYLLKLCPECTTYATQKCQKCGNLFIPVATEQICGRCATHDRIRQTN